MECLCSVQRCRYLFWSAKVFLRVKAALFPSPASFITQPPCQRRCSPALLNSGTSRKTCRNSSGCGRHKDAVVMRTRRISYIPTESCLLLSGLLLDDIHRSCVPLSSGVHTRVPLTFIWPPGSLVASTAEPRITAHWLKNVPTNKLTSEQKGSIQVKHRFISPGRIASNSATEDRKSSQSVLSQADAVSTVPQEVRGDWVLFHPVYSQEEMKSVEVHCLSSPFGPSCSMFADIPRIDPPQTSKDDL